MSNWPGRYASLAQTISKWSKDPSTQVGAVIFRTDGSIISMGYNGFPRGINDAPNLLNDRDTKLALTIHAEENALLSAGRNGTPTHGASIAVTHHPCAACAAKLVQAGITSVHYLGNPDFEARWAPQLKLARAVLEEAGVRVVKRLPE